MKVLVTVKEVAEVAEGFEIEGTDVEAASLTYDLNEWDDYAVEAAVQLEEAGVADEVIVATIGPERAEETMRVPLAKGADRAIRVWDDALSAQDLLDVATKADVFAALVAETGADLVLSGVQAADDGFGATGVALARAAGYQWAAVVNDLTVDADAGLARVRRELEGGVEELTEVTLPAVFTIQTGINKPRYASLRGIREAHAKEIDHRSLADLGFDSDTAESALTLTAMTEPEAETETTYLEGDPGEQAAELASILAERGVGGE